MEKNAGFFIRPKLTVMSDEHIQSLYAGTLDVLEKVGVKVMHPEALDLAKKVGCTVGADGVVRFPKKIVEQAIASTPKRLTIFSRDGEPVMTLGGGNMGGENTYFGTGSDLKQTYDLFTGELRLSVAQDIANMARVADALPNIDFIMSYGIPSDAPFERLYRTEFFEMVTNSTKPIIFTSDDGDDTRRIIEMAAAVCGGHDALRQKPFVLSYAQPTSPLQHSGDALGKIMTSAEFGVPVCYPPGLMPGATGPVTLAGAIIQSLAEALSGLVIHQAKAPGAPIVLGGPHGCMDMRTSINVYAAPERLMTQAASTAIYQHFEIPSWGFGGCTDALLLDEQAGAEFGLFAMWAVLTGTNLAHDVGYLGSGIVGDLRAIVLNDEINSYVRHMLARGVPVNEATMALDAIARVGPGGLHLADEHTLEHFKTELWFPELSNRLNLNAWIQDGKKTMKDRLDEKTKEILRSHKPKPLSPETVHALNEMLSA